MSGASSGRTRWCLHVAGRCAPPASTRRLRRPVGAVQTECVQWSLVLAVSSAPCIILSTGRCPAITPLGNGTIEYDERCPPNCRAKSDSSASAVPKLGLVSPGVRGASFSPNFVGGGRVRLVGVLAPGLCLGLSCVTRDSFHPGWCAGTKLADGMPPQVFVPSRLVLGRYPGRRLRSALPDTDMDAILVQARSRPSDHRGRHVPHLGVVWASPLAGHRPPRAGGIPVEPLAEGGHVGSACVSRAPMQCTL